MLKSGVVLTFLASVLEAHVFTISQNLRAKTPSYKSEQLSQSRIVSKNL